jgi:hypothetical protein
MEIVEIKQASLYKCPICDTVYNHIASAEACINNKEPKKKFQLGVEVIIVTRYSNYHIGEVIDYKIINYGNKHRLLYLVKTDSETFMCATDLRFGEWEALILFWTKGKPYNYYSSFKQYPFIKILVDDKEVVINTSDFTEDVLHSYDIVGYISPPTRFR